MIIDGLFSKPIDETNWFDECRTTTVQENQIIPIFTSSLNTSLIDAFRQGTELTDIKYYDAGLAKIFSGEIGHKVKILTFGDKQTFQQQTRTFVDRQNYNPVTYIQLNQTDKLNDSNLPIVTNDFNERMQFDKNGIIEPLTIRDSVLLKDFDHQIVFYAIRGTLEDGNLEYDKSSDRIVSIDYVDNRILKNSFIDDSNKDYHKSIIQPFNDIQLTKELSYSTQMSDDMVNALRQLYVSGSTTNLYYSSDQYVQFNKKSATTGFTFDNVSISGVDSIAFGGLTY